MQRTLKTVFILLAGALLLAACSETITTTAPAGGDKGIVDQDPVSRDPLPVQEVWQQEFYDSFDYEYAFIEGEIDVTVGGTVQGNLALPGGGVGTFALIIPAGVVPNAGVTPYRTFRLGVPVDSGDEPAMIVRLEPDGQFDQPVTVQCTVPLDLQNDSLVKKYCAFLSEGEVQYSDWALLQPVNGVVEWTTTHFSRWPLGTAKGSP